MIYEKPNRYSVEDELLFHCKKGPDGVHYPVTYEVIGQRRKINGQSVGPTGAPLPPEPPK